MLADVGISLANWLTPPHNREAFWRVRDLAPTVPIVNDTGRVRALAERPADLGGLAVPTVGGEGSESLEAHLVATCCDAICVVVDGAVRYEWRAAARHGGWAPASTDPAARHLLMSVSKSLCATVLGAAVGRGDVSLADRVGDVAPEFADTSVADAAVRHLIDMTAGTDFVEDYASYEEPDSEIQVIEYERQAHFRPLAGRAPIGVMRHFRGYGTARPHGAWFDYRSPLTNVVARVLEVATGATYRELLCRDLWAPIGAEHPADIVVDHVGFPIAEAGISCAVRDLARVGLAHLDGLGVGDARVVPAAWVEDCAAPDRLAREAWAAAPAGTTRAPAPWAPLAYRNAWWCIEPGRTLTALGIFGQFCWVHRPTRTVIARYSTWPSALPEPTSDACLRAFGVIVEALAA